MKYKYKYVCPHCGGQLRQYSEIAIVTEYQTINKHTGKPNKTIMKKNEETAGAMGVECTECYSIWGDCRGKSIEEICEESNNIESR